MSKPENPVTARDFLGGMAPDPKARKEIYHLACLVERLADELYFLLEASNRQSERVLQGISIEAEQIAHEISDGQDM